jgi:hypothetical protein
MLEQRHEDLVKVGMQALLDDDHDFVVAVEARYRRVPGSRRFYDDAQSWLKLTAEASDLMRAEAARSLLGLDLEEELEHGEGDEYKFSAHKGQVSNALPCLPSLRSSRLVRAIHPAVGSRLPAEKPSSDPRAAR